MFAFRSTVWLFLFWPRQAHSVHQCQYVPSKFEITPPGGSHCPVVPRWFAHCVCRWRWQGRVWNLWLLIFLRFFSCNPWPMFRLRRSTSGNRQQEILSWILKGKCLSIAAVNPILTCLEGARHLWTCRTLLGQRRCWWPNHNCSWIHGQDRALVWTVGWSVPLNCTGSYKLCQLFVYVPRCSECIFFQRLWPWTMKTGCLVRTWRCFPRDISFQLDNGEQMWAVSVGCNR